MTSQADNDKPIKFDIRDGNPDVLRARDIIPSSGQGLEGPAGRKGGQIPKFDLAEDIMAEQRKITATKRKPPGQINEPQSPQRVKPNDITAQPRVTLSQAKPIITEIVAKDIERLCRIGS